MGQVLIDVPQNVHRAYNLEDSDYSEELMRNLDEKTKLPKARSAAIPPRRHSIGKDGDAVVGIWSDRPESAREIARKIREDNRRVT